MSDIFIGYNNTVDIRRNIDLFMEDNMANIMNLHKGQFAEEDINHYSEKQYNTLLYYSALEYCVNLYFFILENTEEETIEDSEKEYKEIYSFRDISHNLAHYGIDLNKMFEDVKITHRALPDGIFLDRSSYIDYGYVATNITNFAVRIKFKIPKVENTDITIASFNELQSDNIITSRNTHGIKIVYDISLKRIYVYVSNAVYLWTDYSEIGNMSELIKQGEELDIVVWLDYNYDPYPKYGFSLNGIIPDMYSNEDIDKIGADATFMGTTGAYEFTLIDNGKTILGGIYNGTDILSNGKVNIKHFEVAPFSKDTVLDMVDGKESDTSLFRIDTTNYNVLQDEINNLLPITNTSDII